MIYKRKMNILAVTGLSLTLLAACGESTRMDIAEETADQTGLSAAYPTAAPGQTDTGEVSAEVPVMTPIPLETPALPPELSAYLAFLSGEDKLYVQEGALSNFYTAYSDVYKGEKVEGREYDLRDILAGYRENYLWDTEDADKPEERLRYAVLDCGGDGEPELALQISSNYSIENLTLTLIIRHDGERPIMCYAYEEWSRSGTELYYYGFMPSAGSNGADDHSYWADILDAEGRVRHIEEEEYLTGWDVGADMREAYEQVFGPYGNGYDEPLQHTIIRIGEQTFHQYYFFPEEKEPSQEELETFEMLCGEKGLHFVTDEMVEQLLEERCREFGIKEEWLEETEVEWSDLWIMEE